MQVSIITPTYNSERYILETYQCLKEQTHTDWEWLVTDDCSTDSTLTLLKDLSKKDSRISVFSNRKNSGAAIARNNSIALSQGEFIAFLDSDDLWKYDKLEKQLSFMGRDYDFSFSGYELIDHMSKKLNKTVDTSQNGAFSYSDMLMKKATLGCSTVMLRKSFVKDKRMPLLRTGQDYAYWLLLLRDGAKARVIPEPLTFYRITPNSISRNKIKKARRQWEIYRDVEGIGIYRSLYFFLYYAFRAVFRKI
ncbi:putative teichuronic acid biosynthesis glycosyltransferase TuaG [Vibrio chagasii]|uniref:glycosyltransferase family 2 protein n=1 Tax=Vibrio chagasii TaxID=170679 RepID=UPI00336E7EB1|nr:putative teichuronic acid biosynthesis glycosyltransferase TuaG [Vibrio chagasii]